MGFLPAIISFILICGCASNDSPSAKNQQFKPVTIEKG